MIHHLKGIVQDLIAFKKVLTLYVILCNFFIFYFQTGFDYYYVHIMFFDSQYRCLFTHVGVTLVAYSHNVKLEKLAFGLFRNSGKSDLMSNIRKISNSFWN